MFISQNDVIRPLHDQQRIVLIKRIDIGVMNFTIYVEPLPTPTLVCPTLYPDCLLNAKELSWRFSES